MLRSQAEELIRQLEAGKGKEEEDTRGMTLRELVLELRIDNKDKPSRREVYSVLGVYGALMIGLIAFL
jgi:hypothetical protein